ncbi:MAG: hypothetical protein OES79_04505 [Planctomycetota bacterium]|nr:hypothetical protein [Planctomycetota bacterium]
MERICDAFDAGRRDKRPPADRNELQALLALAVSVVSMAFRGRASTTPLEFVGAAEVRHHVLKLTTVLLRPTQQRFS